MGLPVWCAEGRAKTGTEKLKLLPVTVAVSVELNFILKTTEDLKTTG